MRQVVVAADAEATLALLSEIRGVVRVHARGDPGAMRLEHQEVGPVSIDRISFDFDLDTDVGPVDKLVFGQVSAGAVGFQTGGAEHWHRDGVYLTAQPGHPRTSLLRGGIHDQVVFDPGLPSQVAASEARRPGQPVRFTGYEPVSPQAAQTWKRMHAYIRGSVLEVPEAAAAPLVVAAVARHVVAVALAVFPNTTMTAAYLPGPGWVAPASVRRAAGYIDAYADQPITVDQIAVVAGVSGRALRSAFRRYYGTTAMGYLRQVRLERARAQLQAADPAGGTTIAAVARTWGWANPARFAVAYERRFGVSPSLSTATPITETGPQPSA